MKKILLVLSSILLLCVSQATAIELVNDWDYSLQYYFSEYTIGGVTTTPGDSSTTTLAWGEPWTPDNPGNIQSSLSVEGFSSTPYAVTNGAAVQAAQITHNNFPISGSQYLTSATITAVLTLQAHDPAGPPVPDFQASFDFYFQETPNAPGPTDSNDIFLVADLSATMETFVYDGYEYTVVFAPEDGGFLPLVDFQEQYMIDHGFDPTANAGGAYIGFSTLENDITKVDFEMTIKSSPIPEPATLILFGFGLLGLAGASRKKLNI